MQVGVQSLGRKDPLEKEMATHSNVLAWEIPWMEGPRRLQSMGLQRIRHNWATNMHAYQRNNFHESRAFHLPTCRKALHRMGCLFFVPVWLAIIFWCLTIFFFPWQKFIYPGSSLSTLEEFLRAIREAAFPGHSSQLGHQIEHNSQLFCCMFFFHQQLGK